MSALRADPAERATLSEALRLVRKHRGMRQIDVAEAMGLPIRTYQNFEAGRIHLDFEKIKAFAAATDSDPHAILAAVMIGSPAFALRSTQNKLTSVLMTALQRFDERLGDDIARIEVGRLIKAFRKVFADLETELAARDAQTRRWFDDGGTPSSDPDEDDDAT